MTVLTSKCGNVNVLVEIMIALRLDDGRLSIADRQRAGLVERADGDRLWSHDLAARAALPHTLCRHHWV